LNLQGVGKWAGNVSYKGILGVNTDTIDMANKSLGVSNSLGLDDRGLKISIRHNGDKATFEVACRLQEIIVQALNELELETSLGK